MINFKPLIITSLVALVLSSQTVQAQNPYNYGYGQQYNPYAYNRAPYGYGNPNPYRYGNQNYYRPNNNFFSNGPFNNSGRGRGNNGFGEQFWPGRGSVYDDVLPAQGPWNRNWGRAPWNRDYDNLWGRNGGPSKWFDPGDPKEGVAQAWEDMMITPNALGTMPGGWKAPSISIPNPVDVGDELKNAAKDMPGEMRNFSDGFTYGGDDNGYGNDSQGGRDNGGISIDTSSKR